ncbi:MAG: CmcI family methyltransferase [Chloroflexota bacterium]
MKLIIDTDTKTLTEENDSQQRVLPLYSDEAFQLIAAQWLKVGWNQKYSYTFTWMGRPVIQLPEDMLRIQEVLYRVQPDVIIETGIAHGGSLIYYASLCKAFGKGHVIGIDIEIRRPNRTALESHELASYITLIEGSSTDSAIVEQVKALIKPDESVLVLLDSSHLKQHVLNELNAYCDLVTPGSYLVATDGIMKDLYDVPHGDPSWTWDNPVAAVEAFLPNHPEFVLEPPVPPFNESTLHDPLTYWPSAWLRRKPL